MNKKNKVRRNDKIEINFWVFLGLITFFSIFSSTAIHESVHILDLYQNGDGVREACFVGWKPSGIVGNSFVDRVSAFGNIGWVMSKWDYVPSELKAYTIQIIYTTLIVFSMIHLMMKGLKWKS